MLFSLPGSGEESVVPLTAADGPEQAAMQTRVGKRRRTVKGTGLPTGRTLSAGIRALRMRAANNAFTILPPG
jgi:hypothetical protein